MLESVKIKKSIMFVASECNPYCGTGGLADVAGSLPAALAATGECDVRVVVPMYSKIDEGYRKQFSFLGSINVPLAWRNQYCGIYTYAASGVTFYFLDNEYYFKRDKIYGEYDDAERFAFFSKAALEIMPFVDFYPHLVHCHDWQTALVPIYLKTLYESKIKYRDIKTVFTIHNIEYQGNFGHECLADLFGLPEYCHPILDFNGVLNLVKGAIEFSDRVSTVSPTYAREIHDSFFAHGLQDIIARNSGKISGILNGIDEVVYNPSLDDKLFERFTATKPEGKIGCKAGLQRMLGLPEREDVPVVAMITRLASHKGLDLVNCVLEEFLQQDVQFVVLGTGEKNYENFFSYLSARYQGKMRFIAAYNKDLASKIYAGSDIFLMPSKQEPCGLSQMIACRYGTLPVVRKTGGLADSIVDVKQSGGFGYVFEEYNAHDMLFALKQAVEDYKNKPMWKKLVKKAMTTDFSWNRSAKDYTALYDSLIY